MGNNRYWVTGQNALTLFRMKIILPKRLRFFFLPKRYVFSLQKAPPPKKKCSTQTMISYNICEVLQLNICLVKLYIAYLTSDDNELELVDIRSGNCV